MTREISLDEDFETTSASDTFYVDKTKFIGEWYRNNSPVTLITRPRRFGKTLTMNMVERFFSVSYKNKPEPFLCREIARDSVIMALQGTIPVISLTFMCVEGQTYEKMIYMLSVLIREVFEQFRDDTRLKGIGRENAAYVREILNERYDDNGDIIPLSEDMMANALARLSRILCHAYKKDKVIILLDEYDTPLQCAYLNGYWNRAAEFFGLLFKKTFKENKFLDKALITGISRVSKESLFSPFNNLPVCSVTSPYYEDTFGFTQKEVDDALAEYMMMEKREEVKHWYDGYRFGNMDGMYNPWSIVNFLSAKGEIEDYWVNTASNEIVSNVLQYGSADLKDKFVALMQGENIVATVSEDTTYKTILSRSEIIWGLLLACGYLKAVKKEGKEYTLAIVNHEVRIMMDDLVLAWFKTENDQRSHDDFTKALADCDEERMQESLSLLSMELIGSSDGSDHEGNHEPEKFYHGFVLGIVAALRNRFVINSNRESGTGRSDILMEPKDKKNDHGIIIEFKVFNPKEEKDLEGTCDRALEQIEKKKYALELMRRGVPQDRIVRFGIGYKDKEVLVKAA